MNRQSCDTSGNSHRLNINIRRYLKEIKRSNQNTHHPVFNHTTWPGFYSGLVLICGLCLLLALSLLGWFFTGFSEMRENVTEKQTSKTFNAEKLVETLADNRNSNTLQQKKKFKKTNQFKAI